MKNRKSTASLGACVLLILTLPCVSLSQDRQLSSWLAQAEKKIEARDYNQAKDLCNRIINSPLASDNDNSRTVAAANHLMFRISEQLLDQSHGHIADMQGYLENAVNAEPQNPKYRIILAEFYELKLKNGTKAIEQYEIVVNLPMVQTLELQQVLPELIELCKKQKLYNKAELHFRRLLPLITADSKTLYEFAVILRENGNFEEAMKKLVEAIDKDDKNWDAYVALGKLYEADGQYQDASASYNKAQNMKDEAKQGVARVKKLIADSGAIDNMLQGAKLARQKKDIKSLTQHFVGLSHLQQQYPLNKEIGQEHGEVRTQLEVLWLQKANGLAGNENTLKEGLAAYDSASKYADSEIKKNRIQNLQNDVLKDLGVTRRAEQEYEKAEEKFREEMLEEAKKSFTAAGQISASLRSTAEKKQVAIEYYLGTVALKDSFKFDEAEFYFNRVIKQDSKLRQDAQFEKLPLYFETASRLHRTQEEIIFLKQEVALDSLLGKKKAFLEKLLPRFGILIAYFDSLKQGVERQIETFNNSPIVIESSSAQEATLQKRRKNLEAKRKAIGDKIGLLERDRNDFQNMLTSIEKELSDREFSNKRDTFLLLFVAALVIIFVGFFVYKIIKRYYPAMQETAKRERGRFIVALGAAATVYQLIDSFLPSIEWKRGVVIGFIVFCILYYLHRVYREIRQAGLEKPDSLIRRLLSETQN